MYVLPIYYTRHPDIRMKDPYNILKTFLTNDIFVNALDFSSKNVHKYFFNMPSFVIVGYQHSDVFQPAAKPALPTRNYLSQGQELHPEPVQRDGLRRACAERGAVLQVPQDVRGHIICYH